MRLFFVFCLLALGACGVSSSSLMSSREARRVLGAARDFPRELTGAIDRERIGRDWAYQRQSFWSLWKFLFSPHQGSAARLEIWQSWYSTEDLGRLFHQLFSEMNLKDRRRRLPFTAEQIEAAFEWHDAKQFDEPSWDQDKFDEWLATFSDSKVQRSIPGFNKILLNRSALAYILETYPTVYACFRQRETMDKCPQLRWPQGAALLKTAWRRRGDGFILPNFPSDLAGLHLQFGALQWTPGANWLPQDKDSYAMQTRSGQTFDLAGMHLMYKLERQWLWSSIWLGASEGDDLAIDHVDGLAHYRLCSLVSFQSALDEESPDEARWPTALREAAASLRSHQLPNWCSNPFLEIGTNNQKTNCIGCHQFAGFNLSRTDLTRRLTSDLPSLQQKAPEAGPSDSVWSLINGPDALALPIADTIEYFDAYDPSSP